MKNICKRLFMLCAFLGVFTILPETAEAAKLSMKNTDSQITLKYDDRYTFKKEIKEINIKNDLIEYVFKYNY